MASHNAPAPETHVKIRGDSIAPSQDLSTSVLKLRLVDVLTSGNFAALEQLVQEQQDSDAFKQLMPLILNTAVQVAPLELVQQIVSQWGNNPSAPCPVNINEKDADGNTPLHLAAAQSRSDIIQFLLEQPLINECAVNNSQQLPFELCKNVNVAQMMQITRANYIATTLKEVNAAMAAGDLKTLDRLYKNHRNTDFLRAKFINRTHNDGAQDPSDTLLHLYIHKRNVKMCNWLLDHGADPMIKNSRGLTPIDMLSDIIKATPQPPAALAALHEKLTNEKLILAAANRLNEPPTHRGFLKKFTNFAQGYKLRWFVLAPDGKLSYYKDQAAAAKGAAAAARGTLNLADCYLHLDSTEKLKFEIISNHNHTKWQLKGNHPVETNNWVWAIQSAIRFARDKKMMAKGKKSSNVSPGFVLNRNATQSTIATNYSAGAGSPSPLQVNTASSAAPEQGTSPTAKFSSGASINSTDIELSDRLTKSGKNYVSKMIETKLESASPGDTSPVLAHSLDPQQRGAMVVEQNQVLAQSPLVNKVASASKPGSLNLDDAVASVTMGSAPASKKSYRDDEIVDTAGEDEDDEDNQDEGGIAVKFEKDEEYLKIEYGPFIERLNVCQKTIGFELDSMDEILASRDFVEQKDPQAVAVVRKSLKKVYGLVAEMNKLTAQRDEKLISMLAKQSDVNNIWIQSVRDLEVELGEKTDRLASIDRQRKSLKKTLQKKLIENSEAELNTLPSESSSFLTPKPEASAKGGVPNPAGINTIADNSSDTLAQIAKFISATREEDENSEADEFFDAEELMKEIDNAPQEAASTVDDSGKTAETIQSDVVSTAIEQPMEIPELSNPSPVPAIPAIAINDTEVVPESEGATVAASAAAEVADETADVVAPIASTPSATLAKTATRGSQAASHLSKTQTKSTTDKASSFAISDIARTEHQEEKEKYLVSEKSYNGYEDGIRKRLKLDEDDRPAISLWAVLKSMVGKDMTRMTLPVTFNEPTSLLQRVAEDLEYTEILDQAATFDDSSLRCLYAGIFTASCYASTTKRVAKPFNPLLGETYEYTRPDKHYRFFTEQVSHHPPISATWTESPKWDFWGESHVETKFNGRSFGVQHLGMWHIKLRPDCGGPDDFYTYKKPDNTVIGILVGNPQVDNHGEVRVQNHITGDVCVLNFKARGWRSSGAFEVTGEVFNKKKEKVWVLGGHWNDSIYAKKVTKGKKGDSLSLDRTKTNASHASSGPNYDGQKFLVWKVAPRPDAPFHLTPFAITLNAPQPKLVPWLAPTDTRLRPDQRAMEDGEYDKAADDKHRLEEKQRAVRKKRDEAGETYAPKWFTRETHPITKQGYWKYSDKYWKLRRDKKLKEASYDIF